ncbi:MAG: DUF2520 domain-containing protein [Prevotellaceae bacterium]|jgi:predicted short-subunit dehydrogenase-like oxidoreductase (DUF2520 family)|nr:DUF2520 domain-containing protein [Prevotellaceae bacterium]
MNYPNTPSLPSIVLIGAGNLAVNLAKALYRNGYHIEQVYSRTREAARALSQCVAAEYTNSLASLTSHADLYITALTDRALPHLLPDIVAGREQALFVHTAGSIDLNIWQGYAVRYGVFYPMQTFSKQRETDFREIPLFIESNSPEDCALLHTVASHLSRKVYTASSEQRRSLHLAAVFACNFSNCMYALAADILHEHDLPFEVMLPLIDETARKVHQLPPQQAQTGPAIRGDEAVMASHLDLLKAHPDLQELYQAISRQIKPSVKV